MTDTNKPWRPEMPTPTPDKPPRIQAEGTFDLAHELRDPGVRILPLDGGGIEFVTLEEIAEREQKKASEQNEDGEQ